MIDQQDSNYKNWIKEHFALVGQKYQQNIGEDQTINDIEINTEQAVLHHNEGVDLVPSNLNLSMTEVNLFNAMKRDDGFTKLAGLSLLIIIALVIILIILSLL